MSSRSCELARRVCRLLAAAAALLALQGCATNPVTGKRELHLISEDREIAIGLQQYVPAQQSQGGTYTADPSLSAYVATVGRRLATQSDRPQLPFEFVILNNSVPNAWAMPGGKIAVNRGLLTELKSESELAAVLGHEITHSCARHGAKAMERGILFQTAMVGVMVAAEDHRDAKWAVGAASLGAGLTQLKYSRDAEREADEYGVKYMQKAGYDPQGAVELQEAFVRMQKGAKANAFSTMFSSHPPSEERVKNLREIVVRYPPGGTIGEEEYAQHIQQLKKAELAYKSYDSGMRAIEQNNPKNALTAADEAIRQEPREALFYSLKGDALARTERLPDALTAFDEAIGHNDNYFYYHLRRGQILQSLGRGDEAQRSLDRSIALLPTADAHLSLGLMAQSAGRTQEAYDHFNLAAGSDSQAGLAARVYVARAGIANDPSSYIRATPAMDDSRRLVVQVHNASPVAVHDIVIETEVVVSGRVMTKRVRYVPDLAAGHVVAVDSKLGAIPNVDPSQISAAARVISAVPR